MAGVSWVELVMNVMSMIETVIFVEFNGVMMMPPRLGAETEGAVTNAVRAASQVTSQTQGTGSSTARAVLNSAQTSQHLSGTRVNGEGYVTRGNNVRSFTPLDSGRAGNKFALQLRNSKWEYAMKHMYEYAEQLAFLANDKHGDNDVINARAGVQSAIYSRHFTMNAPTTLRATVDNPSENLGGVNKLDV